AEKQNIAWKATEKHLDTPLVSGPTTPLPDKKLLGFILDRLQKKDTYGVYAEPVDPEELPDYHEIIENPMDFGTVRKKLEDGAYANLEQFENDVLLISSNAMQYNAPDTIYFRQARRIHELAKRDFENLRLDSDNEQRPKIVRRGRPPKNLQKQLVKTSLERDGLDATLTKGADGAVWSNSYNLRKTSQGSRNNETYSWLPEHKFDKTDDFLGSSMKGFWAKYGKKHFVMDESRRTTYKNSLLSVVGSESSVLSTFDGETKQLLPVGLHTEHGYARSLARYAANLGPVAWRMASKKIERALPPGMKFGPGWVGDDEAQSVATASSCPFPHQQPFSLNQPLSSSVVPLTIESKGETLLKQELPNIAKPNRIAPSTMASSSTIVCSTPEHAEASRSKDGGLGLMNNGSGGIRPQFQIHHPVLNPGMNGFSGGFGPNPSSQMGKLVRPGWSSGNVSSDTSVHSRILDMASKSNFIHSMSANHAELYNSKLPGSSSNKNSGTFMPNSIHESQASIGVGQYAQPYWNEALVHQKPDSIPPDLNLRFQSPGSPSSSVRVDSPQPDLALQL
ncbi:Bromodomain-containing protein, partial [Thalictrum thalictroides]